MAQRVFLIQMPKGELERAARAIVGDAGERRELAVQMARSSALHLRRVTVSEMVVQAAERDGATSEAWDFARNCMPYLIAATRAEAMSTGLRTIEGLREVSQLEDFFVSEARALGMSVGNVEREKFVEPEAATVSNWICEQLDKAADLRERALAPRSEESDPIADYAISTWIWLGNVFARTLPTFWQGRNRWLWARGRCTSFD